MHAERVNDDILYVSKNEKCCTSIEIYYDLIVGYNNTFVFLYRTGLKMKMKKVPTTRYYIRKVKDSWEFRIPTKLGKIMTL